NPKCTSGVCGIQSCFSGYANCDLQYPTGCEINLTNDKFNCGACGHACTALPQATSTACVNSTCVVGSCLTGHGDCDSVPTNGCETDLNNTPAHCGSCTTPCSLPNSTSTCIGGNCLLLGCNGGYSNCDMIASNGCEAHLATDPNNCGNCNVVCASSTCVGG